MLASHGRRVVAAAAGWEQRGWRVRQQRQPYYGRIFDGGERARRINQQRLVRYEGGGSGQLLDSTMELTAAKACDVMDGRVGASIVGWDTQRQQCLSSNVMDTQATDVPVNATIEPTSKASSPFTSTVVDDNLAARQVAGASAPAASMADTSAVHLNVNANLQHSTVAFTNLNPFALAASASGGALEVGRQQHVAFPLASDGDIEVYRRAEEGEGPGGKEASLNCSIASSSPLTCHVVAFSSRSRPSRHDELCGIFFHRTAWGRSLRHRYEALVGSFRSPIRLAAFVACNTDVKPHGRCHFRSCFLCGTDRDRWPVSAVDLCGRPVVFQLGGGGHEL